jgi:hypothetical protein
MKLDRNTNVDGKGKYALINLRTNKIEYGNENNNQFFVMKYKDCFAVDGLRGYLNSVKLFIKENPSLDANVLKNLLEYAEELEQEVEKAKIAGAKTPD